MSAKLPTSKAKTAYGLLSAVRKLILAEPLRYNQARYIARTDGKHHADNPSDGWQQWVKPLPACGTAGCVAGWVATLKRGDRFSYKQTQGIAARILGLNSDQSEELFGGGAVGGTPQTKSHAKAGARHIAAFQEKYATQLKAKAV